MYEEGRMGKPLGNRNMGLSKSVEERALSKKMEDDQKKLPAGPAPYFHKDCISNILIWLPLESLPSSRFVCKPWYNIINSRTFIDSHFRRSESVLIFLKSVSRGRSYPYSRPDPFSMTSMPEEQGNTFSVEVALLQSNLKTVPIFGPHVTGSSSKFFIQFMEFKEGKIKVGKYNVSCLGNIRATCNGLILLDNHVKKGLIVMNPVTRKLITLPLGTLCNYHKESYGFALNHVTGDYKLVHLFRDEFEYVTCETLDLATRSWRAVNGPSFGLFNWFGHAPVSAIGALHWIPQLDNSDFIVSMEVENERFHCIPLPHRCTTHDRVMEMGGLLCFVTHEDLNIDIWNLKSVPEGIWTKQYSITKGSLIDMVPLFSLRISGDVIFRRKEDGSFHAYDFKSEVMREFEMDKERNLSSGAYLPHVNSLLSWTPSHHVSD